MDVLLLHAGVADHRLWGPQMPALEAAGHRPVAPDLPGFGETPLEPGTVDYVGYAAERLPQPGALVGCSFGGRVALELALAQPERVQRLVLIAASIGGWEWSEATRAALAEEEAELARGDLAAAAAQQARMWLAEAAAAEAVELTEAMTLRSYELQLPLEGQVEAVWPEPPAAERLEEIAVPTLVVVGEEDVEDVHAMAAVLVGRIPDARLEPIARAAHLPSLERPDEVNRLLLEFLEDGVG